MITTIGVFATHIEAESSLNELRQFGVCESDCKRVRVFVLDIKRKPETRNPPKQGILLAGFRSNNEPPKHPRL